MTSETTSGRQPVQIVRIDQPFCANTYGIAPCTATGAAGEECYNTRASCQDGPNFNLSTLPLYFGKGSTDDLTLVYLTTEAGDIIVTEAGDPITLSSDTNPSYIIPSLVSVSTTPTKINLAGSNDDMQGLGSRAIVSLVFNDHPHTDRVVDPYVETRPYTPMDNSTFWTKWIVRNKYRQNIPITVYDGYVGQALSEMVRHKYFMQNVSYPTASGKVTMQGKDILAKLEERKSQYPVASSGYLFADIDAADTSFEVANAVLADYDAAGTVRIDDEIMTYTSIVTTANGVTFSGVTRGTDFTSDDTHTEETTVQRCVRITNANIEDVLEGVLVTGAGIPTEYLDLTGWEEEFGTYLGAYRLNAVISEPTGAYRIVSELQVQCQFYAWWDERVSLVKVRAIRGIDSELPIVTDAANIIADSVSIVELPKQRASQVWVYHSVRDWTLPANDDNAFKKYKAGEIRANLESEADEFYGEASVRKIFARFLNSGSLANTTATRIANRYVDVPRQITFSMDAKDRDIWTGDTVQISHPLDITDTGARKFSNWTITSAEEIVSGEVCRYTAEDTTIYGKVHYIMAAGTPDYPGYDNAPFKNCYIGDVGGLLSDGENCGRIS